VVVASANGATLDTPAVHASGARSTKRPKPRRGGGGGMRGLSHAGLPSPRFWLSP
jgi:hypothetical protein